MNTMIMYIFNGVAIVATAIVFGTDAFFALAGKKAAAKIKLEQFTDNFKNRYEQA